MRGRTFLLLAVLVAAGCGSSAATKRAEPPPSPGAVPPVDLSKHSVPLRHVVFDTFDGSYVRLKDSTPEQRKRLADAIRPVYRPRYGDPDALSWLRDDDLVLGYAAESGAFAFPLKILNLRELVNTEIDGVPLLVSYCPLCASAVVYSRVLDGRTLLFGNTSALYQSDLVMFDHQTGSYWFQVAGEALVGELTGKRLRALPSTTMPWGSWRRLHSDTKLLAGDGEDTFGARYADDPFAGYAAQVNAERFAFPVVADGLDRRLRAGEIVVAVEAGSAVKAYPPRLIGDAVVNDVVGSVPVVVFSRAAGLAAAYRASASGRRLTFSRAGESFRDRETGTTWNLAGRATAGPLSGTSLEPLPARRGFWFSIATAELGLELYAP